MRIFMLRVFMILVGLYTSSDVFSSTEMPNEPIAMDEDVIFLHVDKKALKADLMTWPESPASSEHLMTLKIAVGKEEGDKQKEGDNKTPEGIYFAQDLIDGKTLPAKYGPFAIPINFPNSVDRSLGKTGYGIWLHGVEKDARIEEAKVTEGCVAFYNADIRALAKWLKPQQTIILISDGGGVNESKDLDLVTSLTKNWMRVWSERQIDSYANHYSSSFKYKNMDLTSYKDYKKRVFKAYRNMEVEFSNLRVFTHKSYAVSVMNQDFNGDDRYISRGRKILYWEKKGNTWKISHEVFENRRFQAQPYSRELIAKVYEDSPSAKAFSKSMEESKL